MSWLETFRTGLNGVRTHRLRSGLTVLGILIGIAFSWRALQATFFGEEVTGGHKQHAVPPITVPERLGACLLLATTIVLGLYPRLLMSLILPALNSPLFEQLHRGAWR